MGFKQQLEAERRAITRLCERYPLDGPWVLAKRIKSRSHFIGDDLRLAKEAGYRTLLSIYSVIRRHRATFIKGFVQIRV